MNSKERLRATLQHKETDKIVSTMECVVTEWDRLLKHFGVETREEIQDILEIDTRIMDMPPYIGPELPHYVDKDGNETFGHPLGYHFIYKWNGIEMNEHYSYLPYSKIETFEDLEKCDEWLNPDYFDYEAVKRFCDKYSDKGIRIGWPGVCQLCSQMFGEEKFYMMMVTDPELVKAALDKFVSNVMEMYERMFIAGDGAIDFLRCCDDYGTQRGMLFSNEMWDYFFAENTRKMADLAHKYNAYYLQHSCGAIRPIIPNLIDLGVDIIEPIQKVKGMEVDGLKADFGDKLSFQGGIDTQKILPFGTPQEVYDETTRVIKALAKGGGYILAPSQVFEGDVPVENVEALYRAGREFAGF